MTDTLTALRSAIEAHARAEHPDFLNDDLFLGDFVLVAHWPSLGGGNEEYTITAHDPEAPAHQVIGLLQVGLNGQAQNHDHGEDGL